jgi:ribonuclease HI
MMEKRSALEVIETLMTFCSEKRAPTATLLWCWWCERNNIREGNRARTSEDLAWTIMCQADAFCKMNVQLKEKPMAATLKWQAPEEGWIKINSDGSFLPSTTTGGWGAVLRDADGDAVACAAGFIPHLQNALHAEVLAADYGLQIAQQFGMAKVCLETDSLILKSSFEDGGIDLSSVGTIVDRMKVFVRSNFAEFKVLYCPRICNQVAHTLAAKGADMAGQPALVTDGLVPCVSDLVASDSASHTV